MSDVVQQIKDRLNIIDVVGNYVELHQAGRHFKGKSPFTSERTPSFYVSPDRGMYYCFSTNQGGDIFTFIQTMEGVDFKEALKQLAERANVELVPEAPERRSERDRSYKILEEATAFFQTQLTRNGEAKKYLQNRGVNEQTIQNWSVGYAPGPPNGGWRELRTHLATAGFSDQELMAAGLVKQPDASKEPFDVFRDRIMFPMWDSQGRVVAFSGRILHPSDKAPKYVNSPETQLYKKSELLFGYNKAKQGIRKLPFWLIAEGQFDVIMSHQAGYSNTVAVSGTALTLQHVQQMERLCKKVVLALDADRAGVAAMQKAATILLTRGFDVKIARLPEGSDPADMIQSNITAFKQSVAKSVHIVEFLLEFLRETSKDDRTYKLRVREELLPFVVLIPNKIDQDHFVQVIADGIQTSADAIRHEVERHRERRAAKESAATPKEEQVTEETEKVKAPNNRQHELIAFLHATIPTLEPAWQERIEFMIRSVGELSLEDFREQISDGEIERYTFVWERDAETMSERVQAEELVDRVNQFNHQRVTMALAECRQRLAEAERVGDEDVVQQQLIHMQKWQKVRTYPPFTGEQLQGKAPLD